MSQPTYTITALPERRQKAPWLERVFWFGLVGTPVSYAIAWLIMPLTGSSASWAAVAGFAASLAMLVLCVSIIALTVSLILFVGAPLSVLMLLAAGAPVRRLATVSLVIAAASLGGLLLLNWVSPWAFEVLQDRIPVATPSGSGVEVAPVDSHVPFA